MFALPRRPRFLAPLAVLVPGLLLGACSDSAPLSVVCPGMTRPSVLVSVVDSVSREPLSAQATGSWISGALADSLRHVPADAQGQPPRLAAYGPAGTYEVRVLRPGSLPWIRRNVEVGQGTCGPYTVELEARLSPAS